MSIDYLDASPITEVTPSPAQLIEQTPGLDLMRKEGVEISQLDSEVSGAVNITAGILESTLKRWQRRGGEWADRRAGLEEVVAISEENLAEHWEDLNGDHKENQSLRYLLEAIYRFPSALLANEAQKQTEKPLKEDVFGAATWQYAAVSAHLTELLAKQPSHSSLLEAINEMAIAGLGDNDRGKQESLIRRAGVHGAALTGLTLASSPELDLTVSLAPPVADVYGGIDFMAWHNQPTGRRQVSFIQHKNLAIPGTGSTELKVNNLRSLINVLETVTQHSERNLTSLNAEKQYHTTLGYYRRMTSFADQLAAAHPNEWGQDRVEIEYYYSVLRTDPSALQKGENEVVEFNPHDLSIKKSHEH